MIKRPGRVRRGVTLLAHAGPTVVDGVRGLWRSPGGRWLVPLVVFLCVTALVLIVGASVEGLAPFIYSIF